jgi:hypothetical protein
MDSRRIACVVSMLSACLSACADPEVIVRRDGGSTPADARPSGTDASSSPTDAGACANPSATRCGSTCVDLQVNASNCGACGRACANGQDCIDGVCTGGMTGGCMAPRQMCGTSCVDVSSSPVHCGACGRACSAGQSCVGGTCTGGMMSAVRTGLVCASEMDCGSNSVSRGLCNSAGSGWPGGYCQYFCESDADCGRGGRCALIEPVNVMGMSRNIGLCFTGCPTPGMTAGCRAGYVCLNAPEGGVCAPSCGAGGDPGACGANSCQASSGLCLQCMSSADCNGGGACTGGTCACTSRTTSCGPNRTCIVARGQCGCINNQGCPAGWICTAATGECNPS